MVAQCFCFGSDDVIEMAVTSIILKIMKKQHTTSPIAKGLLIQRQLRKSRRKLKHIQSNLGVYKDTKNLSNERKKQNKTYDNLPG